MTTYCAPCISELALVREATTSVGGTASCTAHAVLLTHPQDLPGRRRQRLAELRKMAEAKRETALEQGNEQEQVLLELLVHEYTLAGAMDMGPAGGRGGQGGQGGQGGGQGGGPAGGPAGGPGERGPRAGRRRGRGGQGAGGQRPDGTLAAPEHGSSGTTPGQPAGTDAGGDDLTSRADDAGRFAVRGVDPGPQADPAGTGAEGGAPGAAVTAGGSGQGDGATGSEASGAGASGTGSGDAGGTGATEPGAGQPGAGQPGAGQPGAGQPSAGTSGDAQLAAPVEAGSSSEG